MRVSKDPNLSFKLVVNEQRRAAAREQCEKLFADSNLLTESKMQLINEFMYGCGVNPCPQFGAAIIVKISETYENELQRDGTVQAQQIESFFEVFVAFKGF
ncbi:unnamed protein product [Gongylonema pulchrum]|uniref:EF-hand domain-containing protein n=1 Tax=Gongylonema pulchrum TaxID=637853 RepID=A0A183DIH3_9BILA|nr:unnamed protein product [Gongylonema pulchrum]